MTAAFGQLSDRLTRALRRGTALWLALTLNACGTIAPAPRYTSADRRTTQGVMDDLRDRDRAFRHADRSKLLRVVDSYLGVPYKWGGTTRAGMDCSALTRAVYRETFGVELPRTSRQMYELGRPVNQIKKLKAGDLVFFRISDSGPGVSHVGIFVGDGRFAHASSSRGGVIDNLSSSYFESKYAGARRILPQ